tara:strand:+ start:1377 stop:1538 length:162 start_codon:yes stop_codon:yes gene_type:complete
MGLLGLSEVQDMYLVNFDIKPDHAIVLPLNSIDESVHLTLRVSAGVTREHVDI